MKKNGFVSVILIVFSFLLIIAGGAIIYLARTQSNVSQSVRSISGLIENERDMKVNVGETEVEMYPGITNIHLPSGALITFGHIGTSESVPDFIFGDQYLLNDIHNINYLPIKKSVVAFHNSYKYEITNLGCNTQKRFDIDVMITEVTDCTIKIFTTEELPPIMNFKSSTNKFLVVENGLPINTHINDQSTSLLYISAGAIRVQSNIKGKKYIEPGTEWDIYVMTKYGVDTIRYNADELWNRDSKTTTIGPQEVKIKIDNLSCNNIIHDKECPYFTTIDFSIEMKSVQNSNIPIKILSYQ